MIIKAQKKQINWKKWTKIIGISLISIILFVCIILVIVYWNELVAMMNGNQVLSGTMIASLGVNFLSVCNILFGIILKSFQARTERKKNKAVANIQRVIVSIYKISHNTTITNENRIKKINEMVDDYVSDINTKK